MSYIVRRIFSGLLIVFALTWVTFALFWLLPAEPWRAVLSDPAPTAEQMKEANHTLGVDRPVVVQYGKFVWRIVRHGSFGRDYYGENVNASLKKTLPITWSIVFGGAVLLFLLAVPLATLSALRANTALDRAILLVCIAGVALHPFIIGIGLRGLFANRLRLAARRTTTARYTGTRRSRRLDPTSLTESTTILRRPARLGVAPGAPVVHVRDHLPAAVRAHAARVDRRGARAAVRDDRARQGSRYVRRLPGHTCCRNAMLQPLTMIGMEIGLALTVAIYIETMFSLHGAGQLAIGTLGYGTGDRDRRRRTSREAGGGAFNLPVLAGVMFMIALTVIVLNLIVDLTYAYLDPRIRLSGRSAEASVDATPQRERLSRRARRRRRLRAHSTRSSPRRSRRCRARATRPCASPRRTSACSTRSVSRIRDAMRSSRRRCRSCASSACRCGFPSAVSPRTSTRRRARNSTT